MDFPSSSPSIPAQTPPPPLQLRTAVSLDELNQIMHTPQVPPQWHPLPARAHAHRGKGLRISCLAPVSHRPRGGFLFPRPKCAAYLLRHIGDSRPSTHGSIAAGRGHTGSGRMIFTHFSRPKLEHMKIPTQQNFARGLFANKFLETTRKSR